MNILLAVLGLFYTHRQREVKVVPVFN